MEEKLFIKCGNNDEPYGFHTTKAFGSYLNTLKQP